MANGSADLKEFFVSTENAMDKKFLVSFDPYSVPDQMIISQNGTTL